MKKDDLYVESLTIGDLKSIIKDVVREVVSEEITKINFVQIQQVQPCPYPQRTPYPWENPIWADNTHTKVTYDTTTEMLKEPMVSNKTTPCGSLGYKHIIEEKV